MKLIIFMGLQASGKSTFFRNYFAETYVYVSKDELRNNRKPNRRQLQLIEDALREQKPIVVDNTNPTAEVRKPLISLGHMYGAEVIGYYFDAQVSQCIERNKQRIGKARVPDVAIYVTSKKLVRPSYTEGFDKLYYVSIADDATFEVREWFEDEVGDGGSRS